MSSPKIYTNKYGPFPPVPPVPAHNFFFDNPTLFTHFAPFAPAYDLFVDAESGEKFTQHEFVGRVKAAAAGMRACGAVRDGEVVGVFSENHVDYPTLLHAALRLGVPFAPFSSASTAPELLHCLRRTGATTLFVSPGLLQKLRDALKGSNAEERRGLKLRDGGVFLIGDGREGMRGLREMIEAGRNLPEPAWNREGGDKLAYLVQSSGTSGLPKAVMISHSNLIACQMQSLVVGAASKTEMEKQGLDTAPQHIVSLMPLPLYHSYGLQFTVFRGLLTPITHIIMRKWSCEQALDLIPKYKITALPLVPPLVLQLVNHPRTTKTDTSSVTALGSGAAYLPQSLADKLAELIPTATLGVSHGYGQSETVVAISSAPFPGTLGMVPKAGTVNFLNPGYDARFVDPDTGKDVERRQPGELWLRGPTVFKGYYGDKKATKGTFDETGEWLRTGDILSLDEDDALVYVDRMKDVMKINGLQVAATELERTLLAHPSRLISDVSVAAVPSDRGDGGDAPRAWVVLSDAAKVRVHERGQREVEAVVAELHAWVAKRLARYKRISGGIRVVDEIPKLNSGKALRRVLKQMDKEGKLPGKPIMAKL